MPSLFERLADVNLDESSNDRIRLHAFQCLVSEVFYGHMTMEQLAQFYNMTPEQAADAARLFAAYSAKPDEDAKSAFLRMIFHFFIGSEVNGIEERMIEMGLGPRFSSEAEFWARVEA